MRLFLGLPVPVELARALIRAAQQIDLPKARWTAPEKAHLTLVFLGEVADDRLSAIMQELAELEAASLQLRITRLGSFSRTGVLFAEVDPASDLRHLQAQVEQRMSRCDFIQERRPYRPHITLARFHPVRGLNQARLASLRSPLPVSFRVDAMNLYRSHLSSKGSSYEILVQKKLHEATGSRELRGSG